VQMEQSPILEAHGVSKFFPGVVALDSVDFDLLPGEVHALIGENGAGKSTLIKILAGLYPYDAGELRVNGQLVHFNSPADSIAQRIKVVYQELDLVANLSVGENVFLGAYPKTRMGTVDWQTLYNKTAELLEELGLEIEPHTMVGDLRVAEQQLVEIGRALSRNARIIVMDEPTSALSPAEVIKLFGVIRRLKERGVSLVYVSHKLEEIYQIADRVTVFRDGKRIVTRVLEGTTPRDLVTFMVGREIKDLYPKTPANIGEPILEAIGINGAGIHNLNLTVHAGEVVAVFGLMGAGVHTLGKLLFGAESQTGQIKVAGKLVPHHSPQAAIKAGLGLLTENRKDDGLVLPLSVQSNMTLAGLDKFATFSWVHRGAEQRAAARYVRELAVKTPSLHQQIRLLSGGNQQKVLIGRWLMRNLRVLILSEPTRGIDVGAKSEIYRIIDEMAHQGMGILVLSTEIPEVLGMADRILVMREGRITGEFARNEANQENLMAAAAVTSHEDAVGLAAMVRKVGDSWQP
jgi:ribose transport system ATP-binding protein